jgi:hypothetical protein
VRVGPTGAVETTETPNFAKYVVEPEARQREVPR